MTKGVVIRLVADKGFGFIRADGGGEFFFHRTALPRGQFEQVREGQKVEFKEGMGEKGPRAEEVALV